MALDMRSIEEKQAEERKTGVQNNDGQNAGKGTGTVTITPVVESGK